MNTKESKLIANYLDSKLAEFTTALNFWGNEANKTDNSEKRQAECNNNLAHFKAVYDELYSMFTQLSHPILNN